MASAASISGIPALQISKPEGPAVAAARDDSGAHGAGSRALTSSGAADVVTLMRKGRQAAQQDRGEGKEKTSRMGDILFSYNFRGDLRIKFMDSVNSVVYQTPPLHFSRLSDLAASTRLSVSVRT